MIFSTALELVLQWSKVPSYPGDSFQCSKLVYAKPICPQQLMFKTVKSIRPLPLSSDGFILTFIPSTPFDPFDPFCP